MILVDTNVLARALQLHHVHQQPALDAMELLQKQRNEVLVITPQVVIEFYVTATRAVNGLGFTPDKALLEIENLKRDFPLIPDVPPVFLQWEQLVVKYKPTNRRVFDTRHAACMLAHGIPLILTFNDQDFSQYTEIQAINPFDLLGLTRV